MNNDGVKYEGRISILPDQSGLLDGRRQKSVINIWNSGKVTYVQVMWGEDFASVAGPVVKGLPVRLISMAYWSILKKRVKRFFEFRNLTIQF